VSWRSSIFGYGLLLILFCSAYSETKSEISITNLRCEYLENPIGIDVLHPRLSWNMESTERNQMQSSYQILVSSSLELLLADSGDIWNTGKVPSNSSLNIPFKGSELQSNTNYYWKVRVWDKDSTLSNWSDNGSWFMSLLSSEDWDADWIGFDLAKADSTIDIKPWGNGMKMKTDYRPSPCSYLRSEFNLDQQVSNAHAYISALGIYELHINGKRVGDDFFTPGWTDYSKRIYYNTYDVAELLKQGSNTIAVILADGWYAGNIADRGQEFYGYKTRVKAQINITYSDEKNTIVKTNSNWKASSGPIIESDMQAGETYDARLEINGWNSSEFDDSKWKAVVVSDTNTATLEAYPSEPVQMTGELKASEITQLPNGNFIVNFNQNFAGWVKLTARGTIGDSITLRFAEKLKADGSLYTRNLRSARATDTYVVGSNSESAWEPSFTYHGFQYVEIEGYSGELTQADITGVVVHSNLERTGRFSCSNSLINQLGQNINWSQRSNYFDVPTDCPQRDERMGWTGDAQVFMNTAAYNMNIAPFFTKWMVDVADGQYDNGRFPSTAPRVYNRVAAGWGDAGVICPWEFHQLYQDTAIIRKYYPNMVRWIEHLEGRSPNFISTLGSYGDWQNIESETPIKVVSTAYYKRSADLMSEMAAILNLDNDSAKYAKLSANIKTAFSDSFLLDSAKLESETQTAYLLALSFSLIPEDQKQKAFENLVNIIYESDTGLTTGILGTQFLLPTLTEYGRLDLAYQILLNERYPSWGHQINNGATTIWERWDSYSSFQGFHEDSTNSLNHYAYGSVGQWFYSTICGIQSLESGFKKILTHPRPGGGLTFAKADYASIQGLISSHWEISEGKFILEIEIPANTTAMVVLPTGDPNSVLEGGLPISSLFHVKSLNGEVYIEIGSGKYVFETDYSVD
jgi:alpha-L-rhamnosidase